MSIENAEAYLDREDEDRKRRKGEPVTFDLGGHVYTLCPRCQGEKLVGGCERCEGTGFVSVPPSLT